jgi:hypothetical protein
MNLRWLMRNNTALATHTVGKRAAPLLARLLVVSETPGHVAKDENGAGSISDDECHHRIKAACAADPSLVTAYRLCIEARVEHLCRLGVTPAEETLHILQEAAPDPLERG